MTQESVEKKEQIKIQRKEREWKRTERRHRHTCRLYRQLPRDVASISSAAASLMLIAAIICFISEELISIPCRPYMAEAKSRTDIVSVHSVSFSVNAPMRGSTWKDRKGKGK